MLMRTHDTSVIWIFDPIFGSVKIYVGVLAVRYFEKYGAKDWYSQRNMSRLRSRLHDQMSFVEPLFRQNYTGKSTFEEVLVRRGAFCVPSTLHKHGKNELERFQRPDFAESFNAMQDLVIDGGRSMVLDELLDIQTRIILLQCTAGPCAYVRWRPDRGQEVYVGSTKDPNLREPGHANSSLPLARIYSFPTLAVAEAVEKAIHNWLRAECSFSKTGRGFFVMPYDNTLDRIDAYVNQHHRWLLRNTGAVS